MRVDRERRTPRPRSRRQPLHARADLVLQPVLGEGHQGLGREPDVADVLDLQQPRHERLELAPRHVGHVATGDDDVAHPGVLAEVVDHVVVAVHGLEVELELGDLRGGVADEVHPRAVPAVLRAGRQQLGEHLGRIAVRQSLGDPHVVLVERVAGRVGVRAPVGTSVREHRQHVAADRVRVERGRELSRRGRPRVVRRRRHRVEHLRRHEHRHRGALGLVALEVGVELVLEQATHDVAQLLEVLDAVRALPLDVAPFGVGHRGPAGDPGPVRLDRVLAAVDVRLSGGR